MNFFRKQQPQLPVEEALPVSPPDPAPRTERARRRDIDALVPASAKAPDKQRLTMYDLEPAEEGDDEELRFLNEIARQTASPAGEAKQPRPVPSPAREEAADDLHFFRELALERERASVMRTIKVDDVDMGDLLEDLSTTAAALRRRKAA